jgi:hypothetical protein
MILSDHTPKKISIAYPIEHIPRRGRVSKLSWLQEQVPVLVRTCSASDLKLAFHIKRFRPNGSIKVYQENGNLWWPVGSNEQDLFLLLDSLGWGYRGAIGLIGARIRESYQWRMEDKIESREVLHSWRDDALGRAHLAAQNVLLVDGKRAYIRGGCPLFSFHEKESSPDVTFLDACNSGFEYGRPLPIELTGNGANWVEELNVRSLVAYGHVLPLGSPGDPRLARNLTRLVEIRSEVEPSPLDLTEFQLQLLCRDLLETVDDNRHLPFQVRRDGLTLHRLDVQGRPTARECVHAIRDLKGWLVELDPAIRRGFRDTTRLLQSRIPAMEAYRQSGRPSPSSLEPADEEAIAGLSGNFAQTAR